MCGCCLKRSLFFFFRLVRLVLSGARCYFTSRAPTEAATRPAWAKRNHQWSHSTMSRTGPSFPGPYPGSGRMPRSGSERNNRHSKDSGAHSSKHCEDCEFSFFDFSGFFFATTKEKLLESWCLSPGDLSPDDSSHCDPEPASLSECVYSSKYLQWVSRSGHRASPPFLQTPTATRGPSSVQKAASSHAAHSDPGRSTYPETVWCWDQQTHFNRCVCVCVFQSDSSFLDTIYEAYISRFANSTSSKYWFPITRTAYILAKEAPPLLPDLYSKHMLIVST